MADGNPFLDKARRPDEAARAAVLGDATVLWAEIRKGVKADWEPVVEEWKYYGAKSGWSLKTLHK